MVPIGSRIRRYRILAELTQEQLASATGISLRSISAYETNRVMLPLDRATSIASALGVTLDDLASPSGIEVA